MNPTNSDIQNLEHGAVAYFTMKDHPQSISEVKQRLLIWLFIDSVGLRSYIFHQCFQGRIFPSPIGNLEETGIESGKLSRTEITGDILTGTFLMKSVACLLYTSDAADE